MLSVVDAEAVTVCDGGVPVTSAATRIWYCCDVPVAVAGSDVSVPVIRVNGPVFPIRYSIKLLTVLIVSVKPSNFTAAAAGAG